MGSPTVVRPRLGIGDGYQLTSFDLSKANACCEGGLNQRDFSFSPSPLLGERGGEGWGRLFALVDLVV